jgi:hypothetical protein
MNKKEGGWGGGRGKRFRMLPHLNTSVGIIHVMRTVGGHWQEEG